MLSRCSYLKTILCYSHEFIERILILSLTKLSFTQRVEQYYAELSPNSRKIADHLLHHSQDIISCTVADIAEKTQTSKASVSRFFRQLGYESHADVKLQLTALRASGYPISMLNGGISGYKCELERITKTFENIEERQLQIFVDSITLAKRITLIGFRNSYPVALHFRQQLQQIHSQVRLLPLPGQSISEDLQDMDSDELIIIIGFRRRPKLFASLLNQLNPNQIVLMADPSGQIYKDKVKQLFICQLGQEQALDSYAAPMSLIAIICNRVLNQLSQRGQNRIKAISDLFSLFDEIE